MDTFIFEHHMNLKDPSSYQLNEPSYQLT